MIQAIAFDLDDTLYPEVEFVYSGYHAASKMVQSDYGLEVLDELVRRFDAGQRGDLFTPVLQNHLKSIDEKYILKLVEAYRQHKPKLTPFPEVEEVLTNLKNSYHLAIISDGYSGVQERKLKALGFCRYFEVIILSDKLGRNCWKPSSIPFEECARRLSLDPSCMAYVGDNPNKDFISAKKLGMITIRVRRPKTLYYEIKLSPNFEADYEVCNLRDILDIC